MGTMTMKLSELLEIALIIRHMNGLETGRVHDIRTTFRLATAFNALSPTLATYNDALATLPEDLTPVERNEQVKELQAIEETVVLPIFKLSELQKIEVSDSNEKPHDTFVPLPASFLAAMMSIIVDDLGDEPEA